MLKLLSLLLLFVLSYSVQAQKSVFTSAGNTSYDIWMSVPDADILHDSIKLLVYLDANLKFGNSVKAYLNTLPAHERGTIVAIGIGHKGNYKSQRRRDFIFTPEGSEPTENFGRAADFYKVLVNEIIPKYCESQDWYNRVNKISIVGHSLGGLFSVYCLWQDDSPFDHYIALSPSLWVHYNDILEWNCPPASPVKSLHLFYGELELINKVRNACIRFKEQFSSDNCPGFSVKTHECPGATHNSYVSFGIEQALDSFLEN